MARLTCYHCHITCCSHHESSFCRWSHPRTMPVVAGVTFNATTPDRITLKPFSDKSPLRPCGTRAGGEFESQSYPLSINTRNAREICSKSELIFGRQKQQPQKRFPRKTLTGFSTDFVKNKNRLAGGWPHCVTPTTIPSVFSVPSSITKSEPRRGPRDFLFDEFRNSERDAEFFFACREALAGCRGAALTRW